MLKFIICFPLLLQGILAQSEITQISVKIHSNGELLAKSSITAVESSNSIDIFEQNVLYDVYVTADTQVDQWLYAYDGKLDRVIYGGNFPLSFTGNLETVLKLTAKNSVSQLTGVLTLSVKSTVPKPGQQYGKVFYVVNTSPVIARQNVDFLAVWASNFVSADFQTGLDINLDENDNILNRRNENIQCEYVHGSLHHLMRDWYQNGSILQGNDHSENEDLKMLCTKTYQISFKSEGGYSLTATATYRDEQLSTTSYSCVTRTLRCSAPTARIRIDESRVKTNPPIGDTPLVTYTVNDVINLWGKVVRDECIQSEVQVLWFIYEMSALKEKLHHPVTRELIRDSRPAALGNGARNPIVDEMSVIFQPGVLQIGSYFVLFSYVEEEYCGADSSFPADGIRIIITPPPLTVKIDGGEYLEHPLTSDQTDLQLRGVISQDKDVLVHWLCHLKKQDTQFNDFLKLVEKNQEAGQSVASGCFQNGFLIDEYSSGDFLTIPNSLLSIETVTYIFTLFVKSTETKEHSKSQQSVKVYTPPKDQVNVISVSTECTSNCDHKLTKPLQLRGTCVFGCSKLQLTDRQSIRWKWILIVSSNAERRELKMSSGNTFDADELKLPPNEFKIVGKYTILLEVYIVQLNTNQVQVLATSRYGFTTSPGPTDGSCTVRPGVGEALITPYIFECQGFNDSPNYPPQYRIEKSEAKISRLDGKNTLPTVIYQGPESKLEEIYLPVGSKGNGYRVKITFIVTNQQGKPTTSTVYVVVNPPTNVENITLDKFVKGPNSKLNRLIRNGDIDSAVQVITSLISLLKQDGPEQTLPQTTESVELLHALNTIKVANLQKAFQISTAVVGITDLYLPNTVELDTEQIIDIYNKTISVFESVFQYFKSGKEVVEQITMSESVTAVLNVASNLAQIISKNSSTLYQQQEDLLVKRQDLIKILYDISKPLQERVEVNIDENEVMVLSSFGNIGLDTRHGGLYTGNAEFNTPVSVSTFYYNPFQQTDAENDKTDLINLPVVGISTLDQQGLIPSSRSADFYDVLIPTRKNKTSLDLVSEASDVKRVLLPRPCDFPIAINSFHIATPDHECGAAVIQFKLDRPQTTDRTKRQAITENNDIVAYIVLKPNKPCRIPNAPCIKASFVKTLETKPCNTNTENNTFCIRAEHTVLTVSLPSVSSSDEIDEFQDDHWSIAATDDLLQRLELGSDNNDVILLVEDLQPDVLAKERDRNDTQSYQKVSVNVVNADCYTWSYDRKEWNADSCGQGRLLNGERLHCRCTSRQDTSKKPLLVAASFIIVPNRIDVKDLSDLLRRLHNNPYVILINCLWVVVFLPFFLWARKKDAADKKDSHIFIPEDSDVTCEFFYEIVIFTGIINNAGTTARVTIVLQDSEGTKTEPHVINDVTEKTLNRGGVDTFLIASKTVLKDLETVLIWHDNTGDRPGWYLERIAVFDLQDIDIKVPSCFFVGKWLSLDLYPYTCKLELQKATQRQFLSFENAFKINFQNLFKEANVWTAPLHRNPCSTYTRVQRIACVMVAVFGCMVASIMFYDTSDTEAYSVAMGYVSFNFSTFISSAEAAILLSPINFLITFIFRNLKPPKHEYETDDINEIFDQKTSSTTKLIDDDVMTGDVNVPQPSSMFKGFRQKHGHKDDVVEIGNKRRSKDDVFNDTFSTDDVDTLHGIALSQKQRTYKQGTSFQQSTSVVLETDEEWQDALSEAPYMLVTMRSIKDLVKDCSSGPELRHDDVELHFDQQRQTRGYDSPIEEYNQFVEHAGFLDDSYSETSDEDYFLDDGPEITKVSDHLFSRKFVKVAWLLVWLHLLGCSTVTILYGLQYDSDKFFEWLFSFFLSILQNLFIVTPVRITLTASVMASAKGVYAHQWSGFHGNHARLDALNRWRALQRRDWEHNLDRVKSVIQSRPWCYDIPVFDRLARAGHLKITIAHVKRYWRETVCWVMMAIFVTSLVVLQRDPRVFRLDQRVREYFAEDFYEISEANDVYGFIENLVPTLYNDDKEYQEDDFKLLGPIRLRQVRLKPQPCQKHINATFRSKCKIPDRYVNNLDFYDTRSYSQGWKPETISPENEISDFFGKDLWQYTRVESFYSTKLVFGNSLIRPIYPIGGYVADLGYSSDDIIPIIRGMKNTNWIDYQSAALFIEFSVFTPSFRHVSSVILGIEFLSLGGVNLCLEIYHYRPIYFYSFKDLILALCQVFHVFVNVLILADMAQLCRKDHWRRERACEVVFDVWNFICLVTIFLTTFAYFLYLQHVVNALQVSGMYHADPGRYVPFGTPAYYQRFYFVILAMAAFFSYIRILKVFRGSRVVSLMIQTLYLAYQEVASLTFIFVVFLICFAHVGVVSFSVDKFAFNNFWFTCVNLFQLAGGMDTEHPDIVTSEVWWSIYFCLFMTLVLLLFVNFYAVVLSDAHNNMKGTRHDDHKHPVETLAIAWLYEKLLLLCGISSKHFRDKYAKIHLKPTAKSIKEVVISPTNAPLKTAKITTDVIKSILAKKNAKNLVSKSVHFQNDATKFLGRGSRARANTNQSKISKNKVHDRGPLIEDIRRLLMTHCR